jgi:carbamoyltransferase
LIVDGAGTFIPLMINGEQMTGWETESIYNCGYPNTFETIYKHIGTRGPLVNAVITDFQSDYYGELDQNGQSKQHTAVITDRAGITKTYEAVTNYCGFDFIEAGKTMGLFPYGKPNANIPKLFDESGIVPLSNRNVIIPTYPNGAQVNEGMFEELVDRSGSDLTKMQNRRDLAYACQTQTQEQVLKLIKKASELTGHKKVVISGGYGLNCVANYWYLEQLKDTGIEIYVEPISNDAGTAMGAALMFYRELTKDSAVKVYTDNLYLGPKYNYADAEIVETAEQYGLSVEDATYDDVIALLEDKKIVAMFQGSSENGPRALGNRSIMFDPRFKDGKDFVNSVKRREYFRPFAGSILKEHVHEWFDLRGKEESPSMMYAVNCQPGIEEKIPSIIHVDGTCRIQTVTEQQNFHFYNLIKKFYEKTGVPILFNTSFNLGGDPLVETLEDAANTIARSDINYLFLPEYGKIIKK